MSMIDQPPDDAELVAKSLRGDRDAFGQLYDRYARTARAVVLAVARDWTAVDDLVQESFMRAFGNLTSLRSPALFGRWIAGIARQVAREHRRTLLRNRQQQVDAMSSLIEPHADGNVDAVDRELLHFLRVHLAELPDRERLAIHAHFLEEAEPLQAAKALGLSRSGFYALVQRAVARLSARIRLSEIGERRNR
jgi:RNA polymerase sigma-70 factor (ECF subfamily)